MSVGVTFSQALNEADCKGGTVRFLSGALYAADGRLLGAFSQTGDANAARSGSVLALEFNVLCGRPVKFVRDEPFEMTALELRDAYATQLVFQRAGPPR